MVDSPAQDRRNGLSRITVGGRFFTKYDPNVAMDIIERIADGELLSVITKKGQVPETITKQTFLRWVATVPELATAYSAAMRLSGLSFEEKAIEKAEEVAAMPKSPQNVSAASLLVGQYRWSAARRDPTRYSDKGNTQIVVPINITSSLNLGSNNSQGVEAEVPDIYSLKFNAPVVDGEYNEVIREDEQGDKGVPKEVTPLPKNKEELRALLKPTEPVFGVDAQPIYATKRKRAGRDSSPRKRVLTPRMSK